MPGACSGLPRRPGLAVGSPYFAAMKQLLRCLAVLASLLALARPAASQLRLPRRLLAPADTGGLGRVLARSD